MSNKSVARISARYRWMIFGRVLAASVGGYVVSSLCSAVLALLLPVVFGASRAEGVLIGTLLSFVFYTCIALWVFAVRSATRVWVYLIAWTVVLATLLFILQNKI